MTILRIIRTLTIENNHPLLTFNLLGIALLLFFFVSSLLIQSPVAFVKHTPPLCWFKIATHLPCPTCGLTRAMLLAMQGQFLLALQYNVLVLPLILGILSFLGLSLFSPAKAIRVLHTLRSRVGLYLLISFCGIAWILKWIEPSLYW